MSTEGYELIEEPKLANARRLPLGPVKRPPVAYCLPVLQVINSRMATGSSCMQIRCSLLLLLASGSSAALLLQLLAWAVLPGAWAVLLGA